MIDQTVEHRHNQGFDEFGEMMPGPYFLYGAGGELVSCYKYFTGQRSGKITLFGQLSD